MKRSLSREPQPGLRSLHSEASKEYLIASAVFRLQNPCGMAKLRHQSDVNEGVMHVVYNRRMMQNALVIEIPGGILRLE